MTGQRHVVVQMVEELCYKPEDSEFDSHNSSSPAMALGYIQPLAELSKVNLSPKQALEAYRLVRC
jgi:hypothetical protein